MQDRKTKPRLIELTLRNRTGGLRVLAATVVILSTKLLAGVAGVTALSAAL